MSPNSFIGKLVARTVIKRLEALGLTVITPDHSTHDPCKQSKPTPLSFNVYDWSFFTDLMLGKDIGLAKSYIEGKWNHPDLTVLFDHLATQNHNSRSFFDLFAVNKHIAKVVQNIRSRNSIWWASRNIRSHYDFGNEFFSQFLDESMTYSCGIFSNPETTLIEAQQTKIDRLIKKANLKEGDHILDIGCGWGALIQRAANIPGVKATGITLSREQYSHTKNSIVNNQLSKNADVRLLDYRSLKGKFNHIFSVEMLEAVGHKGLIRFFEQCAALLDRNGTIQIQVIAVPDERYAEYRKNCDFIQKYIFPGGLLPSLATLNSAASHNGFRLDNTEAIGDHYATTLRHWKLRMEKNHNEILKLGYSDKTFRRFEYYFSYCEGAFLAEHIQNYQLTYKQI